MLFIRALVSVLKVKICEFSAQGLFARFHVMTGFIPTWPVVPTKDIPTISFREPWKRDLARINPNRYPYFLPSLVCAYVSLSLGQNVCNSFSIFTKMMIVRAEHSTPILFENGLWASFINS